MMDDEQSVCWTSGIFGSLGATVVQGRWFQFNKWRQTGVPLIISIFTVTWTKPCSVSILVSNKYKYLWQQVQEVALATIIPVWL
jgi:hypothetical protein